MHPAWARTPKPVIGMIHLKALPGSPGYEGSAEAIAKAMLRDAEDLVSGGVDGLMMENFFDTPFFPGRVPAHVVASMTALAAQIRSRYKLPLGINVLRNDGVSALAVAQAVGAAFIRVNVLAGARLTDQGVIQGIAHDLLRERANLRAGSIGIFGDVNVKHSGPLGQPRPLEDEVADLVERGGVGAIIVSGTGTGKATDVEDVRRVKAAAGRCPVWIGSGATAETVRYFMPHCDGFIVGTSLKRGGVASEPVDIRRVKALMAAVKG